MQGSGGGDGDTHKNLSFGGNCCVCVALAQHIFSVKWVDGPLRDWVLMKGWGKRIERDPWYFPLNFTVNIYVF